MMMTKGMKSLLVAVSFTVLAGCSSFSDTSNPNGMSGQAGSAGGSGGKNGSGVSSQGLGSEGGFNGTDLNGGKNGSLTSKTTYYFKFDSNTVQPSDVASIEAHGRYLMSHPSAKILLSGNTDSRGSREYNVALGERRAEAVEQIMLLEGVNKNQIRTLSYGEEKPVALGHTEADYRLNRRVDLEYEAK